MKFGTTVAAGLLAWLALAVPGVAGAAVRHVSVNGADGTNDCMIAAAPCRTVTHAMRQAIANATADGDVVSVGPGVYSLGTGEVFPIEVKPGVKLLAAAIGKPEDTVLDGAGSAMGILQVKGNTASGTRIEGFTLRSGVTVRSQPNAYDMVSIGGAIRVLDGPSGNVTITRNILRDNAVIGENADGGIRYAGGGGRALGGGIGVVNAGVTITSNLFLFNAARGGAGHDHPTTPYVGSRENGGKADGGAIGLSRATGAIVNNTFESNLAFGGNPGSGSNGTGFPGPTAGGAVTVMDSNVRVVNNLFSRNQSAVANRGNTFAIAGAIRVDPVNVAPIANLHFGTRVNDVPSTQGDTMGTRAVLGDPLFASSTDWHIRVGSAAMVAGVADAAAAVDMEGVTRRSPPTIGAYEYAGNLPPDTTIVVGPSGTVSQGSALVVFSSPDTSATFQCSFDNGAFAACTSPVVYNGLADGPHVFRVRARDLSGNVDPSPAVASWTVVQPPAALGVPYNLLQQKSSHNSYERDEALMDQLVFHRIRSIEFDIHNTKSGWSRVPGDWYVYHSDHPFSGSTTCHRLSDCLNELRAFHLANPDHEVITVFLDLKDHFEYLREPYQLDELIQKHLPAQWLLKPKDLLNACPGSANLRAAVTGSCGWPTHLQLRGRFIFALTGGDLSWGGQLTSYAPDDTGAANRVAFVAPSVTNATEVTTAKTHAIFFNIEAPYHDVASHVAAARFVSRVWGVDSAYWWNQAAGARANHIGTDYVNHLKTPWAVSHNALGFPFGCGGSYVYACPNFKEPSQLYGVQADSGDIWGNSDSFYFAYENTDSNSVGWNASISTPNSHVEEWGKGCLMARASLLPNAAYVAMCRAADRHKLRMQYRQNSGGSTSVVEIDIVPADTVDQESLSFVALEVLHNTSLSQTCVKAYGAQTRESWRFVGSACVSGRLPFQGLAVSSHGGGNMKMLFTDLRRNEQPWVPSTHGPVGAGAYGWAFKGFAP